jgi:hypothetical protein
MTEEKALEILSNLADALEAAAINVKHQIAEITEAQENLWSMEKIAWTKTEGSSGPYEKSEDVNNPHFKAMLTDLEAHKGKMTKGGFFIWVFENGSSVGRKRRETAEGEQTSAGESVSDLFPDDLRALLSFEMKDGAWIIKPKQFLGSENFAKIAELVKKNNGAYVSKGKDSHFRIVPKSS